MAARRGDDFDDADDEVGGSNPAAAKNLSTKTPAVASLPIGYGASTEGEELSSAVVAMEGREAVEGRGRGGDFVGGSGVVVGGSGVVVGASGVVVGASGVVVGASGVGGVSTIGGRGRGGAF